jgi:6-phosphogluconolactonase
MYSNLNIHSGTQELSEALAKELLDLFGKSESDDRKFYIALSGGSTPGKLFDFIACHYRGSEIWKQVRFYWVDERCVPPDHDESNYRMAYKTLLRHLDLREDQINRIRGEQNAASEAKRYSNLILEQVRQKEGLPVFDLILLGMGADGHTASIFPDRLDLLESKHIYEATKHPDTGQERITLTGRVINNANHIFFLVSGSEKSGKLASILNKEEDRFKYPAAHIKPFHGRLAWFLDLESACLLHI